MKTRNERLLFAGASACVVAVLAYAAVLPLERLLFPPPNPATVIWSVRSSFTWRVLVATYVGGMGGFGGFAAASRAPAASARWLARAVILAAAAVAITGTLLP